MNLCRGKTAKLKDLFPIESDCGLNAQLLNLNFLTSFKAQLRSMFLLEIYLEQYHRFSFTKICYIKQSSSHFSQIQLCYIHDPACARKIIISKGMAVCSSTPVF